MTDEKMHADVEEASAHADQAVAAHDDTTQVDAHAGQGEDDHGHGEDDHGHGGEALGPIDWGKWAYAIAGAITGVIVLAFFLFALGGLPA